MGVLFSQLGMQDELPAGEHKGALMKEVVEKDPRYIYWAVWNLEWFIVDRDVIEAAKQRISEVGDNEFYRKRSDYKKE